MPTPTYKAGLQRILGMGKYLAQYILGEATINAPLSCCYGRTTCGYGNMNMTMQIKKLTEALMTAAVLLYFDTKKPLIIETHASGLGVCVMREGHPVACASRGLTDMKKELCTN